MSLIPSDALSYALLKKRSGRIINEGAALTA